jgi:hypothetical protein
MVETRVAPRFRVSKAATIEFSGGRPINCVVRNLSVTGAAVELPDLCGIPDSFDLVIPDDGLRLPCRIARRPGYMVGVSFD